MDALNSNKKTFIFGPWANEFIDERLNSNK